MRRRRMENRTATSHFQRQPIATSSAYTCQCTTISLRRRSSPPDDVIGSNSNSYRGYIRPPSRRLTGWTVPNCLNAGNVPRIILLLVLPLPIGLRQRIRYGSHHFPP
ncbi:hypothetical protein L226DRAFT_107235 [Lentinus tigrinus ALCF2SS1-7]|uniref:Uncharacterized protein n=1 Tax=Lentinus tigrinus ALCF2SS1-6 TaxID=1328759 RepID=A0A5C2S5U4_9APHY|nr:hypothetical protein L227DRAFT_172186 [Lentinus tigrinus ALCF2SS1-6]RPD73294.1 hypothetical protein L226DRAFT_107235 [Lentinus tigrinus ALCF2SS1-7]